MRNGNILSKLINMAKCLLANREKPSCGSLQQKDFTKEALSLRRQHIFPRNFSALCVACLKKRQWYFFEPVFWTLKTGYVVFFKDNERLFFGLFSLKDKFKTAC